MAYRILIIFVYRPVVSNKKWNAIKKKCRSVPLGRMSRPQGAVLTAVQSSTIVWYTHKYSHSWSAHGTSRREFPLYSKLKFMHFLE